MDRTIRCHSLRPESTIGVPGLGRPAPQQHRLSALARRAGTPGRAGRLCTLALQRACAMAALAGFTLCRNSLAFALPCQRLTGKPDSAVVTDWVAQAKSGSELGEDHMGLQVHASKMFSIVLQTGPGTDRKINP